MEGVLGEEGESYEKFEGGKESGAGGEGHGEGEEDGRERLCRTHWETVCTTNYIDRGEGRTLGNTSCSRYQVEYQVQYGFEW